MKWTVGGIIRRKYFYTISDKTEVTALTKDAMDLLEQISDDKLYFIIQIMEGVSRLCKTESQSAKEQHLKN